MPRVDPRQWLISPQVVGNGVVVHLPTLFEELHQLDAGSDAALAHLVISSRAHVLLDSHRVIDGMIEAEKEGRGGGLGTTKRGIGPCYASKMNRNGLRFCDLVGADATLVDKLAALRAFQGIHYVGAAPAKVEVDDAELKQLRGFRDRLVQAGSVKDTVKRRGEIKSLTVSLERGRLGKCSGLTISSNELNLAEIEAFEDASDRGDASRRRRGVENQLQCPVFHQVL